MVQRNRADALESAVRAQLDRRQFILRGGGSLIVTGGLAALLEACGGSSSSKGAPVSKSSGSKALGQRVVIGSSEGDPANLDAQATYSFALTATVGSAAHAYLLVVGKDGTLQPDLAVKHELVSPTKLRFQLRPGVKFHNGRPLEPKDVKASYERVLDKKTASPFAAALAPVARIETEGTDSVVFVLKQPYAPLPALTTQIPIIPIETADQQKTKPVGAGPFKFKEWQQGNFMDFERFEDYYDKGFPKVAGVRFLPQTDASTLRSGFLAKQSSGVVGFTWPDLKALKAAGSVAASTAHLNGFQFFCMNTKKPPFDDVRVRQAISLGTDRKRLAAVINGPDWPAASLLIDPNSTFYPSDVQVPYDPEKAKSLLQQAGVAGSTIEGLITDIPVVRPIGPVWQDEMSKIGLKLKTVLLQPADLIDRVITRGDYQITQFGDAAPPDPSLFLDKYYATDGSINVMKYSSKQVDKLLGQADESSDDARRKQIYSQVMKLVTEDAPIVAFAQNAANYATYETVGNFAVTPIYTLDLRTITNSA